MKAIVKHLALLTSFVVAMSVTSCVNDDLAERQDLGAGKIAALEEQAAAVEVSVKELKDLQNLLEANAVEMNDDIVASLEQHAEILRNGALSLGEGTSATFQLQKQLGAIVGTALAELDADNNADKLMRRLNSLEKGISNWVGENFNMLYSVTVAQARVNVSVEKFGSQLNNQKIYVDALMSDVEAGFRKDEKPEELKSLAASVQELIVNSSKLAEGLTVLASDVEKEYESAVASVLSEPAGFDGVALKEFNANAAVELAEVDNSLAGLSTRVATCESQLASILERLGALETEIENLEELLGMIQSVTLMTEYSAEEAVAKYTMLHNLVEGEDYKERKPTDNVTLNYVVRPASAAAALETKSLWNNGLKVFGYYANRIEQSSVDFVNFNITDVQADELTGVVTVTIDNDFIPDFYYKKTGAKLALSISTGKTDLTSKFVEVVPKDASRTIYLERLTLSKQEVEFDEGEEYQLTAIFTPENVTDKELVWTTANGEVASVDGNGRLTGTGVGETKLTVTSKGTDEWGRTLSATCKVKVNPAIRLMGPAYVEEGKNAELTLDFPSSMVIESKEWYTSDETKATVSNEGVVSGVAHTYNQFTYEYNVVTVNCKINESITLSHEMKVVVPQPRQVKFNNYADDAREITVKVGQSVSLEGTILPAEATSNFRLFYESNSGVLGWVDDKTGVINGNSSVGTVNVYARVFEIDKHHRFAPGKSLTREVVVKVEPYWVKSLSFASPNITFEPGQTTTLTPIFTSDVAGVQPTYTDLRWVSSNPSVVSVNETTGEIITKAEGTAQITATTNHDWSVPSGSSQLSATCSIIVEKPTAPINVGDYYYSDGTWSTTRDLSKTVIGIVFAKASPATADKNMMVDYPKCTHGLVVALGEYNSKVGNFGYSSVYGWLSNNGYEVPDTSKPNGYGLTKGLTAYRAANPTYCDLYDSSNGPSAKHNNTVKSPSSASSWYIPSFNELKMLYDNKSVVNTALSAAGGTQVTGSLYWSSTFRTYNSANDCQGSPFDMTNGKWYAYDKKTTEYPVRVVLAF